MTTSPSSSTRDEHRAARRADKSARREQRSAEKLEQRATSRQARQERRAEKRAAMEQRSAERSARHQAHREQRKQQREQVFAERAAARALRDAEREAQRARRAELRAQVERTRTEQRARVAREARTPVDMKAQLKLWLGTLDALLTAVESTAWQTRQIGENVWSLFQARPENDADSEADPGLSSELSGWKQKLTRVTSTGLTLGKIGVSYRLFRTKAAFLSREGAEQAFQDLHADSARALYELSVKHGGAFLKLGQMLASRPDLLPEAYVRELSKLQDAAPAVAFSAVRATIEQDLGRPLTELFASFEDQPVAAASIGQVHRARLHDGRLVAVKVQRPRIRELVALDMELLELFVRALAEGLPPLDFDTIIRETRAMVWAELDYQREASLTAQLSEFFANDARIHVPAVVSELSSPRILVTEFMPGEKITNVLDRLREQRARGDEEERRAAQGEITVLLARVLESYARQVLQFGVFQADPHPGNLLADAQGNLTVLDFGCAKELDVPRRKLLLRLLQSTVARDVDAMAAAMDEMGFKVRSGSRTGLRALADAAVSQMALVKQGESDFVSQLEMVSRIAEFGRHIDSDPIVHLPEEFVMLGRVFGTLSGLFVHYQPDVSATASVLPVLFMAMTQLQAAA